MTEEQQKQTVGAFTDYLYNEGVNYFVLAYQSDGALTIRINANEDFPEAIAFAALKDELIEHALLGAVCVLAKEKGCVLHLKNNTNEN